MAIYIPDMYTWHVNYHDGTKINEFDDPKSMGRVFAEIDGASVRSLVIEPQEAQSVPGHGVIIPEGATPVFFRRRTIELDPNTDGQKRSTIHCIGWKRDEQAVYLFVFDDGSVLLSEDLQAV